MENLSCLMFVLPLSMPWIIILSFVYFAVSNSQRLPKTYGKYAHVLFYIHLFIQKTHFGSVQFSRSVVPDSLRPHESQHTRPPCPSPTVGVYPNSCPLGRWCHPTISSSVVPFASCPQFFPASGSLQMSQLFASGGQSIGIKTIWQLKNDKAEIINFDSIIISNKLTTMTKD